MPIGKKLRKLMLRFSMDLMPEVRAWEYNLSKLSTKREEPLAVG